MKTLLTVISLILISGCVSSGVKVDDTKLGQFTKGQTTYADVIHAFGQPSQITVTANGRTATYMYVSVQTRPESFIPVAGMFVGGADSESSVVMLTFDKKDILQDYTSSQNSTGTGTGFEAYSQARAAQPTIVK